MNRKLMLHRKECHARNEKQIFSANKQSTEVNIAKSISPCNYLTNENNWINQTTK